MNLNEAILNIANYYFTPPPGKPVAIVCDREKTEIARVLAVAVESLGHPTILPVLEGEPDIMQKGLERLLSDNSIALAVFTSDRMWRTLKLQERLTFKNRFPSLVSDADPVFFDAVLPSESLVRLYSANPESIQAFIQGLRMNLADHAEFHLTTPGGTDLHFTSRTWEPWAWEMMTCPIETTISGRIVVDGGVFFSQVSSPIELNIEAGQLRSMDCRDRTDTVFNQYRQWMMEAMEKDPRNTQLCEVGLGANPNAQISNTLMESEAVQGTAHFCFGDNVIFTGMGGENATGWHGGTGIVQGVHLELG